MRVLVVVAALALASASVVKDDNYSSTVIGRESMGELLFRTIFRNIAFMFLIYPRHKLKPQYLLTLSMMRWNGNQVSISNIRS